MILPRFGGSCALCVDGLGWGGEPGIAHMEGTCRSFLSFQAAACFRSNAAAAAPLSFSQIAAEAVLVARTVVASAAWFTAGTGDLLTDLPAFGHELRVALLVRRFYCRQATCPKRTFAERFPGAVAPHARRTRRLSKALSRVGIALGGAAGARLARGLGMPVSRDTLLRVIRALPLPAVEPPRVVGVDDWALRKGRTYGTILVDLERHRVLDLLADRSANTVAGWLRDQPGIVVVARDRSAEYARAATNGAGQATQVADRWHLLANTRQMLERWLFAVHGRLRRLPLVHTDASAIAPRRTRAFPRPRAERVASAASHERWLGVYKEVRRRHAAGETLQGIARSMGLARGTVRKYVQAQSFPERALRAPGPSALDPFIPHLTARVAAGCENGMELWREVRALGYAGRPKAVISGCNNTEASRRRRRPTVGGRRRQPDRAAHQPSCRPSVWPGLW